MSIIPPTFHEQFLPTQPEQMRKWQGDDETEYARLLFESIVLTSGVQHPIREFDVVFPKEFPAELMSSNPVSVGLLQMLIRLSGATHVLEIGTFVGISAMHFAKAMPSYGHVVTIEKGKEFADLAFGNIQRNGYGEMISVINGDAADFLKLHVYGPGAFDLAFIDGDKARYDLYFDLVEPLVRSGGMIVVDDAFFHGDALNEEPDTDKGHGCKAMLDKAAILTDWQRLLLPLANGILILVKP